jgi:RNA-directed DNA polymerase
MPTTLLLKDSILPLRDSVESWKNLPWRKFDRELFRLQHRIYKATRRGNIRSIHKLQSLVLGSESSRYLAVRQVTQLNLGKKTPGVDGIASLNPKQRLQLANELKNIVSWKHQPLRRVYIPKPSGDQRPLGGIPTLKDRAMQCLLKYALEPVYEAHASRGSYGFRPGRSTWDIQKNIFINLQSTSNGFKKRVLELDIEKCFDKIDHNKLMSMVILPGSAKKILWTALRAGVLKERSKTLEGTPPFARSATFASSAKAKEAREGGVISPLLCNIALHGIEDLWNETISQNQIDQRGLRYADDMIFFIKPHEDATLLRKKIDTFLLERGLNVKAQKTRLVYAKDGFDFLGWHFTIKSNLKFLSYPSKDNYQQMIKKMKYTLRDTRFTLEQRLYKARLVFQGWWKYHKYCDMSEVNTWPIRYWTNQYIKCRSKMNCQQRNEKLLFIFGNCHYKVNSFVAVRTDKSIYDNDWLYWSRRGSKRFYGPLLRCIKQQNYRCMTCNLPFKPDDRIELHHLDGNHKNNVKTNVAALNRFCHQHQAIHGLVRRKGNTLINQEPDEVKVSRSVLK